jgi:hypothetical protein
MNEKQPAEKIATKRPVGGMQQNVSLHIERLVLDGVDIAPGQRHLLQVSVASELTRLLSEGGLAPQLIGGGAQPRITSPAIQFNSSNGPTELGRQIAGAVYGGIGK